jgi:hypothetical protein
MVDVGGSVHRDPAVAVLVVVPAVETGAELSSVFERAEGGREVGRYFRVLKDASE